MPGVAAASGGRAPLVADASRSPRRRACPGSGTSSAGRKSRVAIVRPSGDQKNASTFASSSVRTSPVAASRDRSGPAGIGAGGSVGSSTAMNARVVEVGS